MLFYVFVNTNIVYMWYTILNFVFKIIGEYYKLFVNHYIKIIKEGHF